MAEISLSELCLEAIAEHIALCCTDQVNGLNDVFKYSDDALSQLSDSTIEEILDVAVSKEILSEKYFALLIHKNVLKLDFSGYQPLMITDHLLLQLHCKKLVSLNLKKCSQISPSCLNQFIQNLTSLTCLNLSCCSQCSNSVLENLSKSCPNLKELNLESCTKITDHGIAALLKADSSEAPLKISHLNLSSTAVTSTSFWISLVRLPLLVSLTYANVDCIKEECNHVCYTMFMQDRKQPLQLQHLDISGTLVSNAQLNLILKCCSNLVELKLNISLCAKGDYDTFSQLSSVTSLSRLRSLHIEGEIVDIDTCIGLQFQFERLEPFLKQVGQQLESLNLSSVKDVKLSVLCLYCNSLKHLVLTKCELVPPFLPSWKTLTKEKRNCLANTECDIAKLSDSLSQLQHIHFKNVTFNYVSLDLKQELLYQMLTSHSKLLQLSLKSVPIEQKVLIRILQSSSGTHLVKLVLSCYDNITVRTINVIKESCSDLKHLELLHCWIITWADIWQMNEQLRQNGSKLEIVTPEINAYGS